ncbi:MAG: peptidoglycan DD-metalloendopeptidase family protein [Mycoplasmatales bacterium]
MKNKENSNEYKFINTFNILKVFILVFVCSFLLLTFNQKNDFELNNIAFVYDTSNLVGYETGNEASDIKNTYNNSIKEYKKDNKKTILKAAEVDPSKTLSVGNEDYNFDVSNFVSEDNVIDGVPTNTNVFLVPSYYSVSNNEQKDYDKFIKDNTKVLDKGYSIQTGSNDIYVNSLEELAYIQENIIKSYISDVDDYEYYRNNGTLKDNNSREEKVIDIVIKNDIVIKPGYVDGSKVFYDEEELYEKVINKDNEIQYYSLKQNETYDDVIKKFNMTTDDFRLNNPKINLDEIPYEGQEIVVNKVDPVINIQTTSTKVTTEPVKYGVEKKEDSSMKKNTEKTLKKGKNGSRDVTYRITKVNGAEVKKEITDTKILVKPVNKVLKVGTKKSYGSGGGDYTPGPTSSGWIWPNYGHVICGYGCYPGHTGADIRAGWNAPIFASKAGTVTYSSCTKGGYGCHVQIDHGGGWTSLYGHMNGSPPVRVGQHVSQGQVIGFEGQTGNAQGEHCHFEIRYHGRAYNPLNYLP